MTMSCVSSTDAGSRSSLPEPRVRITRTRDSGKPAAAIVSAIARSTVGPRRGPQADPLRRALQPVQGGRGRRRAGHRPSRWSRRRCRRRETLGQTPILSLLRGGRLEPPMWTRMGIGRQNPSTSEAPRLFWSSWRAPLVNILRVRCRNLEEFEEHYRLDLPTGGVFCPTTTELAPGTAVVVEMACDGLPNKVLIRGTVTAWRPALPRMRVRAGATVAFEPTRAPSATSCSRRCGASAPRPAAASTPASRSASPAASGWPRRST